VREARRETVNCAQVEARLAKEDVPWTLEQATGSFASRLAEAARLADLIVLNPQLDDEGPDMAGIATRILMKTGKPVLIVPEESRGFAASGPALVAWDGSLSATTALIAAVPLLKLASEVRILEVQGSSHGSAQEAARYLSRHGIEPEIDLLACFRDAPHETSDVIQDWAAQMGCTYCVMGAYGHSPIREAILGGVTRRMLRTARMPILLVH
jgi:nucleotide-binding universal stress UspA family protein